MAALSRHRDVPHNLRAILTLEIPLPHFRIAWRWSTVLYTGFVIATFGFLGPTIPLYDFRARSVIDQVRSDRDVQIGRRRAYEILLSPGWELVEDVDHA